MRKEPGLNRRDTLDRVEFAADGAWIAVFSRKIETILGDLLEGTVSEKEIMIEASSITRFDTYGAWLLERLIRERRARDQGTSIIGLAERYQPLLDEIQTVNRHPFDTSAPPHRIAGWFEALGRASMGAGCDILRFASLLGVLGRATLDVLARPGTFRLTATVHQLDRVAWQAVPIILLIMLLIGGIIAQQGFFHFRRFGADQYVVDMIGILTLREIGVLIVAIMVAGRSGSAYTAELGAMRMREEIDALHTMGSDPAGILILPRMVALILAVPLLTFLGSLAALYGGGLTAWLYAGMSLEIYMTRLNDAVSLTHLKVGMIKAPFMALVIGIVACTEGFQVKGSAESLGRRTTASVVKSIFAVIVLDGLFAVSSLRSGCEQ